jgi:hypothetical protein
LGDEPRIVNPSGAKPESKKHNAPKIPPTLASARGGSVGKFCLSECPGFSLTAPFHPIHNFPKFSVGI